MLSEKDYQISPIVQESVMHNTKSLQNLQSLSASLFGISAGILGLESYSGFLFYIFFSLLTSLLMYMIRVVAPFSSAAPKEYKENKGTGNGLGSGVGGVNKYFRGGFEFWAGGIMNGFAGFVLTWTLFYGLVRA
ncbi:Rab5-interacting protein-domain-containing protein [Pseudoneurospora amorphoporcata]|uniref:ER membrane protein complex subunit 6 n=1 Tax=Pseudoneurospora amorphoporcata TaxID=241081 RepID=A0AAN6NZD6_9PEZI|nr:Rab5-interacting protein-domain-containing protein [Pseudoneurospora amorphoporcata]